MGQRARFTVSPSAVGVGQGLSSSPPWPRPTLLLVLPGVSRHLTSLVIGVICFWNTDTTSSL